MVVIRFDDLQPNLTDDTVEEIQSRIARIEVAFETRKRNSLGMSTEISLWEVGELPSDGPPGSWPVRSQFDVKRPTGAVEGLHQVAATRTERRQPVKLDYFRVADYTTEWIPGTHRRFAVLVQFDLAEGGLLGA